ncbi:hypothetical protein [Flagellimonas okinawensis]|uniref:Uncharacterized protein n=1 Tax=Flagellimonas okinawensis TaxID=3031324 RepID=A0ABT5XL28_9FLAO|nr:hypothetical protein [[Muricauda] okinawensis]MDF0706599.1 hypothetical protein [[Muricauda] okinawensis]
MIVLSDEGMKYAIDKFNKNGFFNAFMVSHSEHNNEKDIERFKTAINTLGVVQEIHKANILLEEMESPIRIDIEIFHVVLDMVLNQKTKFNDDQRKRYFLETKKLEELRMAISSLSHLDFYFPQQVEFLVLGTSEEEVRAFNQLNDEDFRDIFAHHQSYFNEGLMPYDKFINSLNDWLGMMRKGSAALEVA